MLVACSDSNGTIVSLNVSSTGVGPVSKLSVKIEQPGESTWETSFEPPTQEDKCTDSDVSATVIKSSFYKRLTLPEGWQSGTATVTVRALDGGGAEVVSNSGQAKVKNEEAVAVYVDLEGDYTLPCPEPAGAAGGAGGAPARAGAGGQATESPGTGGQPGSAAGGAADG